MVKNTTFASRAFILVAALQGAGCASVSLPEFVPLEKAPDPLIEQDICGELSERVTVLQRSVLASSFPEEVVKSPAGFCINGEGNLVIDGQAMQICQSDDAQRHSSVVISDLKGDNLFKHGVTLTLSDKGNQSFKTYRVEDDSFRAVADYTPIGKGFCDGSSIKDLPFPQQR